MEINFKWKVTKKLNLNNKHQYTFKYATAQSGRKKKALQNNKRNEVWCLGRAHGSHSISCMRIKVNSLLPVVSLLFF